MKFLFIVQGEGRGHMTQALAMKELIEETGHEVVNVLVGSDGKRKIPPFFLEAFEQGKVRSYFSPSFVMCKNQKVDGLATLLGFIKNSGKCWGSIKYIKQTVDEIKPDVIVNFYEPLYGLSRASLTNRGRGIVIGHQYMFFYPGYFLSKLYPLEKFFGKLWSWVVGLNSEKVALSFYPVDNFKDITVLPPLLRKQLFETKVSNDGSVLVYAVNNGYVKNLVKSGVEYSRVIHCFCEKFWEGDGVYGNLHLHELDGKKFLEYMGKCDVLLCTAGFESLCEAAYLGKKVIAVPTQGHFEQYFNALDAQKYGMVKHQSRFYISNDIGSDVKPFDNSGFKKWVDGYKESYKKLLGI